MAPPTSASNPSKLFDSFLPTVTRPVIIPVDGSERSDERLAQKMKALEEYGYRISSSVPGDRHRQGAKGKVIILDKRLPNDDGHQAIRYAAKFMEIKSRRDISKYLFNELQSFQLASYGEGRHLLVHLMEAFVFQEIAVGVRLSAVFIMEFATHSLRDVISTRKQYSDHFAEFVVASWFQDMARALEFLHRQGVAHRDVKPENTLLFKSGYVPCRSDLINMGAVATPFLPRVMDMDLKDEYLTAGYTLKLADYGISKKFDREGFDVNESAIEGTTPYMAPEMFLEGPSRYYPTPPTDIWALGVSIWEVIHFRRPIELPHNPRRVSLSSFDRQWADSQSGWGKFPNPKAIQQVLKCCMCADQSYRFTAKLLVRHVYFETAVLRNRERDTLGELLREDLLREREMCSRSGLASKARTTTTAAIKGVSL